MALAVPQAVVATRTDYTNRRFATGNKTKSYIVRMRDFVRIEFLKRANGNVCSTERLCTHFFIRQEGLPPW